MGGVAGEGSHPAPFLRLQTVFYHRVFDDEASVSSTYLPSVQGMS